LTSGRKSTLEQGDDRSPSSTCTPQLYNHRNDEISLDEVERILI
jgi:hypothetical protein